MTEIKTIPTVKQFLSNLIEVFEVESILCYGSYATDFKDEKSDIDLLVFVHKMPSKLQVQKFYRNLKIFKKVTFKESAHWENPWTKLNTTLETKEGKKLDVGYISIAWVEKVIHKVIERHEISFKEFPFRPYTFLGLLEYSKIVYDKHQLIKKLRKKIRPIPLQLKKKIVQLNLPMLQDCYEDMADAVERTLGILSFQFYVFMGVDALTQLLWILNDVYDPASKKSEEYLLKLKKLPKDFAEFLNHKLPYVYLNKREFVKSFEQIKNYAERHCKKLLKRLSLN